MTGLTVIFVRESAHQSLTWSRSTRRWPSSIRPVGPNDGGQVVEDGVEVGVEDDLACGRQVLTVGSRPGEVERGLGAGEVAEGGGPAGVQRRLGAEGLQRRGAVGEGPVEVEGVGDVELGLEPHRAGEVHVVVVDRGVARVDVEVAVLRVRGRVDVGEVVSA